MIRIEHFLAKLGSAGIRLDQEAGRLKVHAPKGSMTPLLAGTIRERKAEIIAFLEATQEAKAKDRAPAFNPNPELSFAQQRLWFIDQMTRKDGVSTGTYNIFSTARLTGALDPNAFQEAITKLEMRHHILRANFQEKDGKPVQTIRATPAIKLQLDDLTANTEADVHAAIVALCDHGFSLAEEPLLRLNLIRRGPEEHLLVLCMHHIISDGWSMNILVRELIEYYAKTLGWHDAPMAPLPMQYADFAAWQRSPEITDKLEKQAAWWAKQLAHMPTLHQIPTDRPRPHLQTQNGSTFRLPIPEETQQLLAGFAKTSGASPFMISMAAFQLLLAKYAHQDDIAVGTPIANRNRRELEPLIGFFVNTLVLRTHVDQNQSFQALVHQVRRNTLAAYDHQDVPFEKIVDLIKPTRDNSHTPLFQIMFSMQNQQQAGFSMPGLSLAPMHVETYSAKFDLYLDMVQNEQGLVCAWEFNTDLFDLATIEAMAETFQLLLRLVLKSPQQKLADLSMTPPESDLSPAWGDHPQPAYSLDHPVHLHFEKRAAMHPEHVALILSEMGTSMTYSTLNQRANQWAWHLIAQGIRSEDRVALIAQSSAELVIGLLAIFKAGAIAVPFDANTPEQRLHQMLGDSDVKLALSQGNGPTALPDTPVFRLENQPEDLSTDNPGIWVDPEQVAYLTYTSGSTGTPKASMNTHRGMINHHLWMHQISPMGAQDRTVLKTTVSFDAAMWECFLPLSAGAQLVLGKAGMEGDPFALRQALQEHRVTHTFFVPSVLRALLDLQDGKPLPCHIRHIFCGGEKVQPLDHQRVMELIQNAEASVHFYNIYGPSECAITCVAHPCGPEPQPEFPPIGKPHGHMNAFVVDPHLTQVPTDMPGELVLAGIGLSRGYQNRAALTAVKFVPNPFEREQPGSRLYRTGDLVRYKTDQNLHFVSRIDSQVKLRGMRIELGEIEATLAKQPEITQAAVVVNQTEKGGQRLVAFIKPEGELDATLIADIKSRLGLKLPAYMVPASLVPVDQFPQLPSGKIARLELAKRPLNLDSDHAESVFREPQSDLEKTLADIWSEVLDHEKVGLDDNFFEIGGHSLLATKVVSRIRDQHKLEFPLEKMFSLQTLAEQASWLESQRAGTALPPITAAPRDGQARALSFAQQRLWFIDQLTHHQGISSSAYNISSVLKLKGALDTQALQAALTRLEMRHEVLRTQFEATNGVPLQVIREQPAFQLGIHDVSQFDAEALQQWIDSSTQQGFALDQDPLLRMDLLQRNADEFILILTIHHIISDGWSMNILVQELIAYYSEITGLGPAALPELAIQYADFGAWQQSDAVVEEINRQAHWWESHLAGLPSLHQLPTDRPRPPQQTQNGAVLADHLDPATTAKLEALANASGATLFMVLLTAFKMFLAKYSGQKDIVVGTPIANRNRSQVEPLIGFFVNTLVLRDFMDPNQSFRGLLEQVKTNTLQSYAHQDVPFEKLVDRLQPERQTSYPPLFQIMFSMQNIPATRVSLADLQIESVPSQTVAAKFDLTLDARETPNGLTTEWRFNTDLFDGQTIQRMMTSFRRLVDQILSQPDRNLAQLSLTSQKEWDYQVHTLNQTQAPLEIEKPMYAFIEAWAAQHPKRTALIGWHGETWTYDDLNRRANRIAWQLRELGISTDDRVAVFLQRSPEMIAALVGILKAGAAYIPIDPEYPEQRWAHMLDDSQAPLILTDTALAAKLGDRDHLCIEALLINPAPETNLDLPFSPDQAFFLIYTSGTSGKPKASVNRHRGMVNYVLWHQSAFPLSPDDRVGLKTPFGFDVASWETFWPLTAGASLAIAKPGTSGDPFYLQEWLIEHKVTSVYFVPSMLRAFLDSLEDVPYTSPLRFLFTGGEALPTETQTAVLEKMAGPEGPLEIHNVYGPSEASLRSAFFSCGKQPRRGIMPIGKSLSNTLAYVVDAHGRLQPLGVPGELQVAGVHTSRGYWGKPALTAEKFIPNPFAQNLHHNRIYRTGDLVRRLPEGDMLYLGRVDAQVKLRGMRLELGEIESQIIALDGVDYARVFLNAPSGNQFLVAFIQTQVEDEATLFKGIRDALAKELPSYMIPASMIALGEWPVLPNGKIDSRKLQALAAASQAEAPQESYVAPRTELEKQLCFIWQEVLGMEQVGIRDSFFEIGGHSLLATQVVSRIRLDLQIKISLQQIFTTPTVEDLALWVEQAEASTSVDTIPVREHAEGPLPLSFAQQRLWFLDQLNRQNDASTGTYNIYSTTRITGELDAEALQQAVRQLEIRHEILRTQFVERDGKPVQVLRPEPAVDLAVEDVSQRTDAEIQEMIEAICSTGFALNNEPLMRLSLLSRGPADHLLVLCMHHIISDGWSMNILVNELIAYYTQALGWDVPQLPELPIQYADFTAWQHSPEVSQELDRQAQWWEKRLAHLPQVHQVPTDRPRPQHQTQNGANLSLELGSDLTRAIENLAQASGATPFMILLAAFQLLLAKYSGQTDIAVGTPIANRNRKELEPLIGFFVNTLVLRAQVDANQSFSEFLDHVKTNTLESYDNQDIPFERIVDLLQPTRDSSYLPLFQIMFSVQTSSNDLVSMKGLALESVPVETHSSKFDLHLDLTPTDTGVLAVWQYNTDLFQKDTIATMAANFKQLLRALLQHPQGKISHLALLDEAAQETLIQKLNHRPVGYRLDQTAHGHFEQAADRHPNHPALILEAQESNMSYGDLNQRANQWAWKLLAAGVQPETRVALIAQSSAELVIGLLAILKSGAIALPLDTNTPEARLHQIFADSDVNLVLSQGQGPTSLPGISVFRLEAEPGDFPVENPGIQVDLDQVAYLIYTSGSTGTPKASMNTHGGLSNHHLWMQECAPMGPTDRMIHKTTISFDAAMWELLTPLMFGAQVVIAKQRLEGDPFALRKALEQFKVTHVFFVTSVLRALLDQLDQDKLFCSLRYMFVGGEAVLPQDHQRVLAQIVPPEGSVSFYNIYGPSECAITCVSFPCGTEARTELPPIGRPQGNMAGYVVDPHMALMPIGMPGELMLAGAGLSRGYLNRPALTAAKFIPNPFDGAPGSRLYRSGDLVLVKKDHLLHFVSRIDHQIKLRGMRIELGEIETQLAAHPQVAQAVVVVNQSAKSGMRLVGYFQAVPEGPADLATTLKNELSEKLPAYMVPSSLIALESMPQLPNGKIARVELAQRQVHFGSLDDGDSQREPQTQTQKLLATIWKEVLEVERVGLDDNFFEIGGHSLLATQVVSRVRSELQIEMPLQQIFTKPTIADLALWIEQAGRASGTATISAGTRDSDRLPLSFAQQRLWFMDQLTRQKGVSTGTYNIFSTTRMRGELDPQALQQALTQLEMRHDVLRTQFKDIDGKPLQVVRHDPAITLSLHSLENQTETQVLDEISRLCGRGFSLADEPLMRLDLIRSSSQEHFLVLCMHHIISDGWSMNILVRELITFYSQALGWDVSPLPELPIQYADFSQWQRSPEFAEELDRQAQWWKKRLAHLPPVHQLPTDRPRPQEQTQNGASLDWQLGPAEAEAVEKLAQSAETTPFTVLLAAFQLLLAKYSGQDDIVVGTPIANRNRKELEPLIGFFVNTLVLRTWVHPHHSFLELLDQVRSETVESYSHQDLPFEKLVDLLQPVRDTSYAPLFQIMFSVQAKSTGSLSMPDLNLEPIRVEIDKAKFDLHLDLVPSDKGLLAIWQYNTDLFQQGTILTMARNFQQLLQALLQQPERPLSQVALMDEATRNALVREIHQNQPSYSLDRAAHVHFEQAAACHADHPALILETPNTSMSYGDLNRRANQWAWKLLAAGVVPEARIALIAQSSAELVIGLLAIMKTGAIAVPLDANTPDQRLQQMLKDSGVSLALTQGSGPETLPEIPVFRLEDEPGEARTNNPQIPVDLEQVAFLIYTSGSTGTPKASMNTHRGLCNHHLWIQQIAPMGPDDRMIFKTTISFDLAMWELLMPLMFGAQVVLGKPGIGGDPFALKEALVKHNITHIFFVSSVLRAMLDQLDQETMTCRLRHIFIGGETVLPQDHRRILEQIIHPDEAVHVYNGYGPSECAITCVSTDFGPEAQPELPPIGRPHGNMRAFVVDSHMVLTPIGMPGELMLAGAGLSRGYINRPGLTAAKFVPNPFDSDAPGSRLYRSGDLALIKADHMVHFVSRMDHQVKLRGMRLELGDIESQLTAHPQVAQAAVVINHSKSGDPRLVGYYLPVADSQADLDEALKIELAQNLPAYMIPAKLIALETMPKLPNGKIARVELAQREIHFTSQSSAPVYREPSTQLQKSLATIWQEVLGIERVGLDDNFFEIGGHSLLATQVVSRIRDRMAREFPLEKMFSMQTLAQQAQWVQKHQTHTSLPRITPIQRDGRALELSFAQQRLWFIDQLTRQEGIPSGAYNMSSALKMKGSLDVTALQNALTRLEMRHEVLRTQFVAVDGAPSQVIRQEPVFQLGILDFTQNSEEDVQQWIDSSTQRGFALDKDPLLRLNLLQRTEDETILIFTMHHIISDGWSMNILVQELIAFYSETIGLGPASLPALEIQYADFGVWQRSEVVVDEINRQARWWESHLAGLPSVHQLPTDRPRPRNQTQTGTTLMDQFDLATTAGLEKLGKTTGTTLFMVMLTAFKVFLAKYSGQQDIVVGTPIANRNRSQIEPLIGFFVNTLVLRDFIDPNQSFHGALAQVKDNTLQSYAHQDVPFEKLVDLLQPARDTSYPPLFQIMFSMQNMPATRASLPELEVESMPFGTTTAMFELSLDVAETPEGLGTKWSFNTDLFDPETIQRMMASFKRLVDQILRKPDQALDQFSLTSEADWEFQVRTFNQTQATFDYEKPMYAFIEEWAARHPNRLALTSWNDETWTYDELNRHANRIAWQLRDLGIATDDRVAVFMKRSPEMIAALIAILKAGAAYVAIDPEYPEQRWTYMLEDSQASLILTTSALSAKLGERQYQCVDSLLQNNAAEANLNLPFSPDQAFFLIYTSGTSGKPKASVNRHRGIVNNVLWQQSTFTLTPDDRVGLKTSFGFDVATTETFWPLVAGASIVIAKPGTSGDPFYLRKWLEDYRVTSVEFVPSMLRAMLDSLETPQFNSHLRFLFSGGEALSAETQQAVLERMTGPLGPLEIHNLYGPSEASIGCTYFSCGQKPRHGVMPIGKPMSNTQAYVVDAQGRIQPLGVPGELRIAGVQTSRGYLGKPGLTAERFLPNPFAQQLDDNRLYCTGDLVRLLPQGDLLYLGRVDAQVKLRGMRLELGEIESQINAFDQVDFARVFLNAPTGKQHLVAFIQTQVEDKDTFFKQIRDGLAKELPAHMIPASMIALDSWPLLPNGKIDSRQLQARASESQATTQQRKYVPPNKKTEAILCDIWQDVLGLDQVGIEDPFFDIGGHSLLATQVISRVRTTFQVDLPLQRLFEAPTIRRLAAEIAQAAPLSEAPMNLAPRNEALPLSFAQARFWFLYRLEGPSATYNMPVAFRVSGSLDLNILEQAYSAVVARHENLRTTFQAEADVPQLLIHPATPQSISFIDLANLPAAARDTVETSLRETHGLATFSLETGPLHRLTCLRRGTADYTLLLNMHHIISDGWSLNLFMQEMMTLYRAFASNLPSPLADLAIQYADYASWEQGNLESAGWQKQLDYWKTQLGGHLQPLALPTDYRRPAVRSFSGAQAGQMLDAETSKQLAELAGGADATLFMVLLSGFYHLLARHSNSNDITIGTPIAGRRRSEMEPLIGVFLNTLVLRATFSDQQLSFRDLLDQVRELTLDAYANQDIPFEKLLEVLNPERDLSRTPLFQVFFNMINLPPVKAKPLSDLTFEQLDNPEIGSKFDLTMYVLKLDDERIAFQFHYNADLFEPQRMHNLLEQYLVLLRQVVQAPDQPLQAISLVTEEARAILPNPTKSLNRAWRGPVYQNLQHFALNQPQKIAVSSAKHTLTYQQLEEDSNRLAHMLNQQGVAKGDPVVIYAARCPSLVTAVMGVLKAGATVTILDPTYPVGRLSGYCEAIQPVAMVELATAGPAPLALRAPRIFRLDEEGRSADLQHMPTTALPMALGPDDPALITFTSGSTGKPKGIVGRHGSLTHFTPWLVETYAISAEDRFSMLSALAHDPLQRDIFTALWVGATLCVPEPQMMGPESLFRWMAENQISIANLAPVMIRLLQEGRNEALLPDFRLTFTVGDALMSRDVELLQTFAPNITIVNLYGTTETQRALACQSIPKETTSLKRAILPLGKGMPGAQLLVLNPVKELAGIGEIGEIYIRSPHLALGYLDDPELTAAKFLANPCDSQEHHSVYRTGDLGFYLPDGSVAFAGRADHQVQIRGFRIELSEVEAVLSGHARVDEVAVVCHESKSGDLTLVAYLQGEEQAGQEIIENVRDYLRDQIPRFMIPSHFAVMARLPVLPSGKLDRLGLSKKPLPRTQTLLAKEQPTTPTETQLCLIWQEVLKLDQVGIHENFFDLGGNSLLAMQIHSRMLKAFGEAPSLQFLFEEPTVAGIAKAIDALKLITTQNHLEEDDLESIDF